MREISNDILYGECCDLCGTYFEKDGEWFTHGYPATCWECWEELSKVDKIFHCKANVPPLDEGSYLPEKLYQIEDDCFMFNFGDEFNGSYQVEGVNYDVTIKGIYGEDNSSTNNYFNAAYFDGTLKNIDYVIGTGWIEQAIGQTVHALEIGKIIEDYFLKLNCELMAKAQAFAEALLVQSDIYTQKDGHTITFSIAHNFFEHNITVDKVVQNWLQKTKSYDVESFCDFITKRFRGLICLPADSVHV